MSSSPRPRHCGIRCRPARRGSISLARARSSISRAREAGAASPAAVSAGCGAADVVVVRFLVPSVAASRHPSSSRMAREHQSSARASATSSSAPSSAAPAEPSSGPCRRPSPTTRAAARDDGAATDEAPWAEEEADRSSATGSIGLSTELILECSPTLFSTYFFC